MKYIAPFGSTDPNAPFVDRNTATATRGSAVPADFFNDLQAELLAVIDAAGIARSESVLFQLALAIQSGGLNHAAAGGTADALTVTLSPAPDQLRTGMRMLVTVASTNTDAMTIDVNGLGNVAITRPDGSATEAGDAVAGRLLPLVFDGTAWRIDRHGDGYFLPLAGGTVSGPITLPGPPTEDLHATTRAYVDHPGFVGVNAATTLTVAQLRKYVEVSGSASYTITLPAPAEATTTGGMYWFYNASDSEKTIATPSGNFIGSHGTEAPTMTLPRGAFVWLICGYSNWVIVYQSYSFRLIQSATVLSPSALGGYVQLGGATTFTVTLPNPANFSGASLEIYNSGSISYTLSTPGGTFTGPKGSEAATMTIAAGDYIQLRAGSVKWIAH